MGFTPRTIAVATDRQCKLDGMGFWCAKCCENIGPFIPYYAIPRIPIAKGGRWKINNCVIVCEKCFKEIEFDHTETIPYEELPCFEVPKKR